MSDSDEIDYINKIDFSKGFQRFHVKWPLEDLTRPKDSTIFETTVVDGGRKITLKWSLSFGDFKDSTNAWFGASLMSSGKITPMICQLCLSSSTNDLLRWIMFRVVSETNRSALIVKPSSEVDAYPIDDLMLHLWIDIPIDICIDNNSDELEETKGNFKNQNSFQKTSNGVLLSYASKMFTHVMRADYDPLSDVSLIIVNRIGEELRRFNCHAIFLSNRSDVFERMFTSEGNSVKDGRSVRINDVSARVMETVLEYIYTLALPDPSIDHDHDHLCGIIYAADKYKYNLPELKNWCVGVLILKHYSIDNRIDQLILADRHNLAQLKAICIADLSFGYSGYSTSFPDNAKLKNIPIYLWSEIMKAVYDRQVNITNVTISEDIDDKRNDE